MHILVWNTIKMILRVNRQYFETTAQEVRVSQDSYKANIDSMLLIIHFHWSIAVVRIATKFPTRSDSILNKIFLEIWEFLPDVVMHSISSICLIWVLPNNKTGNVIFSTKNCIFSDIHKIGSNETESYRILEINHNLNLFIVLSHYCLTFFISR